MFLTFWIVAFALCSTKAFWATLRSSNCLSKSSTVAASISEASMRSSVMVQSIILGHCPICLWTGECPDLLEYLFLASSTSCISRLNSCSLLTTVSALAFSSN